MCQYKHITNRISEQQSKVPRNTSKSELRANSNFEWQQKGEVLLCSVRYCVPITSHPSPPSIQSNEKWYKEEKERQIDKPKEAKSIDGDDAGNGSSKCSHNNRKKSLLFGSWKFVVVADAQPLVLMFFSVPPFKKWWKVVCLYDRDGRRKGKMMIFGGKTFDGRFGFKGNWGMVESWWRQIIQLNQITKLTTKCRVQLSFPLIYIEAGIKEKTQNQRWNHFRPLVND